MLTNDELCNDRYFKIKFKITINHSNKKINLKFEKALLHNREEIFSENDVENLQISLKKFRVSLEKLLELKI